MNIQPDNQTTRQPSTFNQTTFNLLTLNQSFTSRKHTLIFGSRVSKPVTATGKPDLL
ncbi:MAG: hypothetical protein F6J90_04990 [Moorea sp. SIOASIH]|uniref:hypothetical protein n=1 Tax=Moorena sp. SIOASIH TaxID=2607817 RepID=UPI0013B75194|nr:hypothetical protein [Moorena sp. SIOASIH]NEO35711.1 hypothetical protein [Moorena sp. SIOASIH]